MNVVFLDPNIHLWHEIMHSSSGMQKVQAQGAQVLSRVTLQNSGEAQGHHSESSLGRFKKMS